MAVGRQSFLLNGLDNTLAADVTDIATTIQVLDAAVLPPDVPFYLVVNPLDNNGREYMQCTEVVGTTLTVTRELEGTENNEHSTGNIVRFAWSSQHLDDIWATLIVLANNLDVFPYIFRTATDGTPDVGEMERDNATVASVTELYFNEIDAIEQTQSLFFSTLRDGDLLQLTSTLDGEASETYTAGGPGILSGGVWTVPVTGGIQAGDPYIDEDRVAVGAVFGRDIKLGQLTDVDDSSRSDLDVLSWIEASQMWEPRANNANKGIVTLEYLYDANQVAAPVAGDVSPNNASPAATTIVRASVTDSNGDSVGYPLSSISENDVIRIVSKASDLNFEEYTVVSVTDQTTYYDLEVTYDSDGGTIVDNDPIWFYHLAVLPNLDATYLRLDTANNPLQGVLDMGAHLIHNVVDPVAQQDAATRSSSEAYADSVVATAVALKMAWKDAWAPGTYELFDTVRDGEWTMVANKQTSDRPAPQPNGASAYVYAGVGGTTSDVVTELAFGARYTTAVLAEIQGYRIYTITGNEYSIYKVEDPLGTPIVTLIRTFTAAATGWQEFAVAPVLLTVGTIFEIAAQVTEPDPTPTVFTGNWNYQTPNNAGSTPASGQIVQPGQAPQFLRVNKTDDDLGDRSAELEAVEVGDVIQYNQPDGLRWSVQLVTDQGTYMEYTVAPNVQTSPAGVTSFGFESIDATPITYFLDAGYWTTTGQPVEGLLKIEDGALQVNDTAYGADILAQEYTASADWDLLAQSGGAGGGGGDGGGSAPNGLPIGGTTDQRLYKIDADDFNTGWKDMLHADLTDVASDDHHAKYTDGEAVAAVDAADVYVKTAGDVMTGLLELSGDPTSAEEAATKNYVDVRDALLLPLGGGTLTGFLTLHADPTAALHAATKQYVDTAVGAGSPTTTLGDIIRRGGSADERLGVGSTDDVLTVVAGEPAWAPAAGGGVSTHDELTGVTTSQHHVKYTDGEAVSANTGIWLSIGGGSLNGDQAIASRVVRNIVASDTEPTSPEIGLVWLDTTAV